MFQPTLKEVLDVQSLAIPGSCGFNFGTMGTSLQNELVSGLRVSIID